jgi:hypothetical protein
MTLEDFRGTLRSDNPPAGLTSPLLALWHDGRGNWEEAHRIAQDIDDEFGCWVHAYLHRKEGDLENARYRYRRAERPAASGSLEAEWAEIVSTFLQPDR